MLNNNYNLEDSHLKVTGMLDRPLSLGVDFADYGIPFFLPLKMFLPPSFAPRSTRNFVGARSL